MEGEAQNTHGSAMPVMRPVTSGSTLLDNVGNGYAHIESKPLEEGVYRLICIASTDNAGVMVQITNEGISATIVTGMYLAQGLPEYFFIKQGDIVSVINGSLNITKVV